MFNQYNRTILCVSGTYQITNTGSNNSEIIRSTACAGILPVSAKGTGSLIDGGIINFEDLTSKMIYPLRLSSMVIESGTIYLLY